MSPPSSASSTAAEVDDDDNETSRSLRASPLSLWRCYVACLFASAATGFAYSFSTYCDALGRRLHIGIDDLDTISSVAYSAGFLTFLAGLSKEKFGCRRVVFAGGFVFTASLAVRYVVAAVLPPESWSVAAMSILTFVNGVFGSPMITAVAYTLTLRLYPNHGGLMVGIMKSWLGLFSGAASEIFAGLILRADPGNGPKTLLYLLFGAAFVFLCTVLVSPFILEDTKIDIPPRDCKTRNPPRKHVIFLLALLTLMCALIAASVFSSYVPGGTLHITLASLLAISYIMPLVTCIAPCGMLPAQPENNDNLPLTRPLIANAAADEALILAADEKTLLGGLSLGKVLLLPHAWVFLFVCTAVLGCGMFFINNGSLMCDSANLSSDLNTTMGGIISIAQAIGRLVAGIASDWGIRRGMPRPVFLLFITAAAGLSHALLLLGQSRGLFLTSAAFAGASFGAIWPMMVLLISDFFGSAHHSANYSFFNGVSAAAGTLLFAKLLPQTVYDSHSVGGSRCEGRACFFDSHLVCVAACVIAFAFSLWLVWKTRHLDAYRKCHN